MPGTAVARQAIILAGGVVPGLRPLTDEKPAALVEVNGRPILDRALGALREAGIDRVTVCTGYRARAVETFRAARAGGGTIELVENPDFAATGSAYGLYLARARLGGDCVILGGQVAVDPAVLRAVLAAPRSAMAVDGGSARAIGIYKIGAADGPALARELERIVEGESGRHREIGDVLDGLRRAGGLACAPCPVGPESWYRIDTVDDLLEAELLFNRELGALAARRVVFLDRDGTLALGGQALPGAAEFVEGLRRRGVRLFVMTNNSSKTPRQHRESLARCGVPVSDDELLLSTDVAAGHLTRAGLRRVYWVATAEVGEYLRTRHGLSFEERDPAAVLLTYDTTLDYAKLTALTRHLQRGVPYFATHADLVCPTPEGPLPDTGSVIELLRLATGRTPELVFGKPGRAMAEAGLARAGGQYRDAAVIGDRLYTDIALAEGTEMLSVLVLSGETTRAQYESQGRRAHIVVKDLERLGRALAARPPR